MKCLTCKRLLNDPADPIRSADCGGDCRRCMAEAGDYEEAMNIVRGLEAQPTVGKFTVRHYVGAEGPELKGNGFDGLRLGDDREEAQEFVDWLNAKLNAKE